MDVTTNLEKWLTTLETTDKAQGKEMLHYIDVVDDLVGHEVRRVEKFCCLGIGCDLAGIASEDHGNVFFHDAADTMAPSSFIRWLGIPVDGDLDDNNEWDITVYADDNQVLHDACGGRVTAANMNDGGLSFAQIAQVLRTHIIKAT